MRYHPPAPTPFRELQEAEDAMFHKLYPHLLEAIRGIPQDSPWARVLIHLERCAAERVQRQPLRVVKD